MVVIGCVFACGTVAVSSGTRGERRRSDSALWPVNSLFCRLQEAHYSTSHGRLDPGLVAQHVHRREAVAGDSSKSRWVRSLVQGHGGVDPWWSDSLTFGHPWSHPAHHGRHAW